jgi:CheY-like chemotaxis protein
LLGGEIKLASTPSEGSTFTLYLPQAYATRNLRRGGSGGGIGGHTPLALPPRPGEESIVVPPDDAPQHRGPQDGPTVNLFVDDTNNIDPGDLVLLIVENDPHFAHLLFDTAHEHGFKAVVSSRGAPSIALARTLRPAAISLDINLPDLDGWRVLDRLKDDAETRHIPVQIITTDEETGRGARMGAIGALTKPIKTKESLDALFERVKEATKPRVRNALVIESDEAARASIVDLIGGDDAKIQTAASGAEALKLIADTAFDVAVVSIDLADTKGFDLIDEIRESAGKRDLPLLLYSTRNLSKKEEIHVKRLTQTTPLKDVRSPERLLDEVSLFLHRPIEVLPAEKRRMLEDLHKAGTTLAGKKVLVVDDDIRNIFAMTSILEPHQMNVLSAETGKSAIETLQDNSDIDVVLMDIMMPDMDGYDTMRAIRKLAKYRSLPIIALTAKAMKGDREKCIEAGASDYIAKPVDTEQLLSLLRVWLYR